MDEKTRRLGWRILSISPKRLRSHGQPSSEAGDREAEVKIQVVVNAHAGGGQGQKIFLFLEEKIKKLGFLADCLLSFSPQEALTTAWRAREKGVDLLVACGGDGTVHSLLPALVNSPISLAVIPLGTANDLARNWKIPLNLDRALTLLLKGRKATLDVIETSSGNYIAGAGGAGFDAAIVEKAQKFRRRWKGFYPFLLPVLQEFLRYRIPWVYISTENWEYHGQAWEIIFSNIPKYALFVKVAPSAKLDDGLMEICLIPDVPRLLLLAHSPQFLLHGYEGLPDTGCFKARWLTLDSIPPLLIHGDGELIGQTPLSLRVLPRALSIIRPAIPATDLTIPENCF